MTILTKLKIELLQKLSGILEGHNAIIFCAGHGKMKIELYLAGPGSDAPLSVPISLPKSIIETDISELFGETGRGFGSNVFRGRQQDHIGACISERQNNPIIKFYD